MQQRITLTSDPLSLPAACCGYKCEALRTVYEAVELESRVLYVLAHYQLNYIPIH